jgi:hypothetical protein
VAAASWFRYAYCAHFSRPKNARQVYRLAKRHKVCRIVEVGITDIRRAIAVIEVAQRFSPDQSVSYTGIDWFDMRGEKLESLALKEAYQLLRPTGANVRLVPGEPGRSLVGAANAHANTDLILISHAVSNGELSPAWYYVPRMLHERSIILREQKDNDGAIEFTTLSHAQVAAWGRPDSRRKAA